MTGRGMSDNTVNEKKKPKGRRAYLDDIRRSPDGGYIYTGECCTYGSRNPRRAVILRLWLMILPAAAACIASGCLSAPFTRDTWYVIAPLGFELVSLGSIVWAAGRITANGEVLRAYVRRQTFGALPLRCGFALAFAAMGLIGAAIYMIAFGTSDQTSVSVLFLILKAVSIACCALIMRYPGRIVWDKSTKSV